MCDSDINYRSHCCFNKVLWWGWSEFFFMSTNLSSILPLTFSSKGSRAVTSTELALLIGLSSFFKSLDLMLQSRLHSPQQTSTATSWCTWRTLASRTTVYRVLSCRQPLVSHWYTKQLQSHQSISGDYRTELYWKFEVYRVKRNCESTVPCGAPVLLTTFSDTQPFSQFVR